MATGERGYVRRAGGEGSRQSLRLPDKGEAAVVRDVQPLVSVADHRLRSLNPLQEMGGPRAHRREEPKRAVDMEPGAELLGQIRHGCNGIEISRIDRAR